MKRLKYKTTLLGLVALCGAALSLPSHAEGNWYIGGAISQAYVDEVGIDEDDTGGKIFGGYKFNDNFAIEGGYYDFGEISDGGNQLEIEGLSLAVVGSIPVSGKFSVFGKAGFHDWDADISGPVTAQIKSNSDTDAFYGIGLAYAVNDQWSVRGEIERYEVENFDIDVSSIGVSFNF